MALFFKDGDQLYREALDLIGRAKFSDARRKLSDAEQKGYGNNGLTRTYIALIDIKDNRSDLGHYQDLLECLDKLGVNDFKFGLTDLNKEDLRTETELDIEEIKANSIDDSNYKAKGQAMIDCAMGFSSRIGDKPLKLSEIIRGNTVATGTREALILQANGYSILGKGTVSADPKTAAEYMQMAYNFRKQIGDSGEEELRLMKEYSQSAKCWICGRPANGQGIHFMAMRSTVEPVFRNMTESDIVKPVSQDGTSIYVCMPCYTAISNKSDEISRYYYDRAIDEIRATEARLEAQITSLRFATYNSR